MCIIICITQIYIILCYYRGTSTITDNYKYRPISYLSTYILHFSVFGLQTVLIKQSAVHIYFKLMFHIK